MSVAKTIEISASSPESFHDAATRGIETVSKTVDNVQSAWVKEMRAVVKDQRVSEFRVTMKVTFVLAE